MISEACEEMVADCEAAIVAHKDFLHARQQAGEPISSAMRQKAVLISFRSINGINAETTATRWHNLKYLHNHGTLALLSKVLDDMQKGVVQ